MNVAESVGLLLSVGLVLTFGIARAATHPLSLFPYRELFPSQRRGTERAYRCLQQVIAEQATMSYRDNATVECGYSIKLIVHGDCTPWCPKCGALMATVETPSKQMVKQP
jgi:hypothetical protein